MKNISRNFYENRTSLMTYPRKLRKSSRVVDRRKRVDGRLKLIPPIFCDRKKRISFSSNVKSSMGGATSVDCRTSSPSIFLKLSSFIEGGIVSLDIK